MADLSVERRPRRLSWLAAIALALALAGGAAAAISGPGSRMGWWSFREGFQLLRLALYALLAAVPLAVAAALHARPGSGRRGLGAALLALLVGLAGGGVLVRWILVARDAPPIHDVTTDTDDPPPFVAVLPLRRDAPNPAEYGGPEVAAQQRAAYPDVAPVRLPLPPDSAFAVALTAAREMGWEIVAAERGEGRIEATATTFWYGFKDDVVVRIRPDAGGSRLDVRSLSRVGGGDAGTNAGRVRRYLEEVRGRAGVPVG